MLQVNPKIDKVEPYIIKIQGRKGGGVVYNLLISWFGVFFSTVKVEVGIKVTIFGSATLNKLSVCFGNRSVIVFLYQNAFLFPIQILRFLFKQIQNFAFSFQSNVRSFKVCVSKHKSTVLRFCLMSSEELII